MTRAYSASSRLERRVAILLKFSTANDIPFTTELHTGVFEPPCASCGNQPRASTTVQVRPVERPYTLSR